MNERQRLIDEITRLTGQYGSSEDPQIKVAVGGLMTIKAGLLLNVTGVANAITENLSAAADVLSGIGGTFTKKAGS